MDDNNSRSNGLPFCESPEWNEISRKHDWIFLECTDSMTPIVAYGRDLRRESEYFRKNPNRFFRTGFTSEVMNLILLHICTGELIDFALANVFELQRAAQKYMLRQLVSDIEKFTKEFSELFYHYRFFEANPHKSQLKDLLQLKKIFDSPRFCASDFKIIRKFLGSLKNDSTLLEQIDPIPHYGSLQDRKAYPVYFRANPSTGTLLCYSMHNHEPEFRISESMFFELINGDAVIRNDEIYACSSSEKGQTTIFDLRTSAVLKKIEFAGCPPTNVYMENGRVYIYCPNEIYEVLPITFGLKKISTTQYKISAMCVTKHTESEIDIVYQTDFPTRFFRIHISEGGLHTENNLKLDNSYSKFDLVGHHNGKLFFADCSRIGKVHIRVLDRLGNAKECCVKLPTTSALIGNVFNMEDEIYIKNQEDNVLVYDTDGNTDVVIDLGSFSSSFFMRCKF